MSEHKIIVNPVFPPIPMRAFDFVAHYDSYEPGCPLGMGTTEQEAIDDLKEQTEED